jgi:hypothetical protein
MTLDPQTALHRLLKLYRDAHHCDAPTNQHALDWARSPELWAEHQVRYRGWSWHAAEATVREARRLSNRLVAAELPTQQEPPAA